MKKPQYEVVLTWYDGKNTIEKHYSNYPDKPPYFVPTHRKWNGLAYYQAYYHKNNEVVTCRTFLAAYNHIARNRAK